LTEEQQGGTTPPAEATAEAHASEQTAATVAVADDPAETTTREPDEAPAEAEAIAEAELPEAEAEVAEAEAPDDEAIADIEAHVAEAPATAVAAPSEEIVEAPAAPEAASDEPAPAETPAAEVVVETPAAVESEAVETPAAVESEAVETPAAVESEAVETPAAVESETAEVVVAAPAPAPIRPTGPEPTTMEELLAEQDADIKSFKHGDVVEGSVVRIDKDEILVDIGAKSEGVVSNRELFGRHGESQPALNIGDTVLVYVLQPESPEGHVVLSLRRAGLERKWRAMQEQFEAGVIIEAPVIDHNKGGLIVDCGIRGFVPISQIVDFPRRPQNDQPRDAAQEIAEKLQPFVGRKLRLKILEVNRKANRLILSEKVALYEERREKRDELFSSLQVGQKVTGTVRSIAPFGVFIDLGGIDGLVHKSELSWNKVNNPEAGYRVGEEVEAEVIDINHERGRISLSIRRLQPDPWHSTVADFKVGDIIDGSVTKLVNFGAFVRVRDGLEGLIHISELSHQRVAHPGDVVHEGQNLKLKIISLDSERHRLGLSLKQAEEPPARPMPEPGAPVMAAPAQPRPERRPRTGGGERERGYSAADAIQEPEGGIDTTLAAAFASVREQLAAAEAAEAEPEAAAVAAPEAADVAEPEAVSVEAEPEPAVEAVAEPPVEAEPEAVAEPPVEAEPEAVAEPAVEPEPAVEAIAEPAVEAEPEAVAEPAVEAEPEAVAEPAVEPEPEAVAEPAVEPEPEAVAEPAVEPEPEAVAEPAVEPEPEATKGHSKAAAKAAAKAKDEAPPSD
jgi:small subunit ribosomal protein S1